jgi:hypothetical protein
VEEPDARIVCHEAECNTAAGGHGNGVTAGGVGLAFDDRRVESRVGGGVVGDAIDDLELVSVQVAAQER